MSKAETEAAQATQAPGKGAAQPAQGLMGFAFVLIAFVILAFFPGQVEALTTTITIITFGLPLLITSTLWWGGWPFQGLSRGASGWANFALLIVGSLVLTGIGQAVTGGLDVGGIFGAEGAFPIFPYGFVLAASIFVTTLMFTFVTGKVPFDTMKPVAAGFAMLAASWASGLLQYFFLLNWNGGEGTPPAPPIAGTGPIYALEWPQVLLSMVMIQLTFFVLLRGFPFSGIKNKWAHFVTVVVFVIAGGFLLNWLLMAVGLNGDQISAVGGSVTAAIILIQILFDGWPFQTTSGAADIGGRLLYAGVLAAVIYFALYFIGKAFYPDAPGVPAIELWMAGVGLNILATFAIIHTAVFRRWPVRG